MIVKKKEEQNVELLGSGDEEFIFEKEPSVLHGETVSAWEAFRPVFMILCYIAIVVIVIYAGTIVYQYISVLALLFDFLCALFA